MLNLLHVAINAHNKRNSRMEASSWIATAYHLSGPLEIKLFVSPKWLLPHSVKIAGRIDTCLSSSLKKSFLNSITRELIAGNNPCDCDILLNTDS